LLLPTRGHSVRALDGDDSGARHQGSLDHEIESEFPFGLLASMEMAGDLILASEDDFEETDYGRVEAAFRKICLGRDELAGLID